MTLRIAVLASGRGSNMVSLLEKIRDGLVDAEVTLVVSDKPGAPCLEKARGLGVAATLELPAERGEARQDYDRRLLAVLGEERPDLIVLAGFMRFLGPTIVDAFVERMVNIHPALLPSFKGAHGIRDTLRGGARLAGCSTHFVTSDLDGGPILLQAALAVEEGEGEESLAARVLRLEHQILPRTVQLIAEGRVTVQADGRVRIAGGPSWRDRIPLVKGALYPAMF